jgi:PAS domain S-box-containing protein
MVEAKRKEMENELQNALRFNAEILESISDGFMSLNHEWRFTYLNRRAAENVGFKPDELLNQNIWEKFPGLIGSVVGSYYHKAMVEKETAQFELAGVLTKKFYSYRVYPEADGISVYWTDITDRIKAYSKITNQNIILQTINRVYEEALRSESIQDLGQAYLEIIESITGSKFSFISDLSEDELSHDRAISDTGWEQCSIYDKSGHRTPLADYKIHGLYGQVLNEGKSLMTNSPSLHPYSICVPSGHPHLTAFLGVPLKRNGAIFGMIGVANKEGGYTEEDKELLEALAPTILEVILHKRVEDKLRVNEMLLRTIIDGTDNPVFLKDRKGRNVIANRATGLAMGATVDQLLGKTELEIYNDKQWAKAIMDTDNRIMDSNTAVSVEEIVPTPEGLRTYLSNKSPWRDANGEVIGILGIAHDITLRKTMELQLEKQAGELEKKNRLITDFFTNISHEFKTPLTIILSAIEMTEMKMKGIEFENKGRVTKNLVIMRQNAHRLLRLIVNLLDVTRIDAGFLQVNLQDMDIAGWMGKLIGTVEDFAANRGITVTLNDDSEIQSMPMDGEKLDRIMLNLLSNAIKHTSKGGHISVTLSDTVDKIMITVADSGEGIPDDKKNLIFDRFRQVDTSMTRTSEGSGIGLALTKSLVELLHGRIWFESRFGEGTIFNVEFPTVQMDRKCKMPVIDGLALKRKVEMEFSDII